MSSKPRSQRVLTAFPLGLPLGLVLALVSGCARGPQTPSDPAGESPRPDGHLVALAASDAATILALHPYPWETEDAASEDERFHGYLVLGSTALEPLAERDRLLDLIERGVEASEGLVAACFNPRHGLRVHKDGSVTEFVICFECLSMKVFVDGVQVDGPLTAERFEPQVTALYARHGLRIHRDG